MSSVRSFLIGESNESNQWANHLGGATVSGTKWTAVSQTGQRNHPEFILHSYTSRKPLMRFYLCMCFVRMWFQADWAIVFGLFFWDLPSSAVSPRQGPAAGPCPSPPPESCNHPSSPPCKWCYIALASRQLSFLKGFRYPSINHFYFKKFSTLP